MLEALVERCVEEVLIELEYFFGIGVKEGNFVSSLLMFGVLIEVCQRMVGYRSAEWLDVAADTVGIIAGLALAAAGLGRWCERFEARYLN